MIKSGMSNFVKLRSIQILNVVIFIPKVILIGKFYEILHIALLYMLIVKICFYVDGKSCFTHLNYASVPYDEKTINRGKICLY